MPLHKSEKDDFSFFCTYFEENGNVSMSLCSVIDLLSAFDSTYIVFTILPY